MKTIFALPLFALALASCDTLYGPPVPAPYPPPGGLPAEAQYRAIGTEPFWDLEIGRDMVFTDRGNDVRVIQPTPRPINGVAGEIYRTARIEANIVHSRCSDGMSDRTYPDTVQVRVDGREFRGCGGPVASFGQAPASMALTGTNWRVTSINGRMTPPRNFYLNFMPDRIGAKFGCNSLGGNYTVAGAIVSVGPVMATRMACPDMSFETQGSAILALPMNVSGGGERMVLTNSAGSIELVRAGSDRLF